MKKLHHLWNASFAVMMALTLAGCWAKKDKAQEDINSLTNKAEEEVQGKAETASIDMASPDNDMEVAESPGKEVAMTGNEAAPSAGESGEAGEAGGLFNVAVNADPRMDQPVNVASYSLQQNNSTRTNLSIGSEGQKDRYPAPVGFNRGGSMSWQSDDLY